MPFVDRLRPRNIGGAGDVACALCGLGHARRGDDLAGEFVDRAHVDELRAGLLLDGGEDLVTLRTDALVRAFTLYVVAETLGLSVVVGRFSSSHFLRPPFMMRTFSWP